MALPLSLPGPPVVGVLLALAVATLTSGQCPEGKFGAGCRHLCHCVQDSACDVSSGVCSAGCQEGYSGPWCQRRNVALRARVDYFMYGSLYHDIDQSVDGNETTCEYLYFRGEGMLTVTLNSSYVLSNIVLNVTFYPSSSFSYVNISTGNGICASHQVTSADFELYTGCNTRSDNFMIRPEDYVTAYLCEVEVFICEPGYYGDECDQLCGHCKKDGCEQKIGTCVEGCQAGYAGDGCHQKCYRETYGENCSLACPACDLGATCHHVTGACLQTPDRLGTGVGVGVAVCVGLAALLVAGLYLVRKRGWGLKRTPAPAGQATSASLPPTPWQPGQPDSRNRGDSQADYSSLELSTRSTDSMYQQVGTPYENMAFGGRDENNK